MKIKWSLISFILVLIGFSCAFADNGQGSWHANIGGNLQKFSNNGTEFAETPLRDFNIDTKYDGGFNLGIGYHEPYKDTDIDLEYERFHTSDSNDVWASPLFILGSRMPIGPLTFARGTTDYNFDSVDLTAGHSFKISPTFGLKYYGGLEYTHLNKDTSVEGMTSGTTVLNQLGTNFNGAGPTFGMEGDCYPLEDYPSFSVLGGVQASLLYGTLSDHVRSYVNGALTEQTLPSQNIVVPAVSTKLAIDYGFPLMKGIKLNTQLGYNLTEYFGVDKQTTFTPDNNTNASKQGPYFDILVRF